MSIFIPSHKWARKPANLPKSVRIAKAKKGKIKVVSKRKAGR